MIGTVAQRFKMELKSGIFGGNLNRQGTTAREQQRFSHVGHKCRYYLEQIVSNALYGNDWRADTYYIRRHCA